MLTVIRIRFLHESCSTSHPPPLPGRLKACPHVNGHIDNRHHLALSVPRDTHILPGASRAFNTAPPGLFRDSEAAGGLLKTQTKPNQTKPNQTMPTTAMAAQVTAPAQVTPAQVTTCCILCGGRISLGGTHNKRKRSLTSLGLFVSLRCQPTPHAFQYFSAVRGEQRVMLCISCVNWQRRAMGQGRRGKSSSPPNARPGRTNRGASKRPYLLLDQFSLFMLRPGTVVFPDQRCVLRLVRAVRRDDGDWVPRLLLSLLPVPVQAMVLRLDVASLSPVPDGSVLNAMVAAWWEYNGRTAFFSHHLTAKLVRRVLKAEVQALQSELQTELVAFAGGAGDESEQE